MWSTVHWPFAALLLANIQAQLHTLMITQVEEARVFIWNAVLVRSQEKAGWKVHTVFTNQRKKKNVRTALSDTQKCVAQTHFPSSRSHGQVSGVLKSPSCVYRWCIALICRIQAPQLRPRLQLLPRQVSLLVTPNVGLPWPSVSEGWRSPRHSGWPCKHVVKLGTADAQLSGVGTGIMKEGGGMRRKRAQAWFKDITESWETSTYQIYTRLSTILHTTVEKR